MSLNKDVKSVWKIIIKFLIYSLFGTILSSYFAPQYFIYFFGITSVWLIIMLNYAFSFNISFNSTSSSVFGAITAFLLVLILFGSFIYLLQDFNRVSTVYILTFWFLMYFILNLAVTGHLWQLQESRKEVN
ncbi:MAG: hypothetical protein KAS39_00615 [Actinomycetia bacterium]|nr:hypothetical protein [Actinomycetes bacterium]